MTKRVLLLGGGDAHLQVLQALVQQPLAGADVALVAPFARRFLATLLPAVVAGHCKLDDCSVTLPPLAHAARVHFIEGSAVQLDAAHRQVKLSDGRVVDYDLLSLDTGAVMNRDRIAGARDLALFVHPAEHFVHLLSGLWDLAARRVLDVVVVGADTHAVELALALAHRLAGRGEERARVALVTGGGEPLPGSNTGVRRRGLAELARCRITIFRDTCRAVEPGAVVLGSGARVACDAPVLASDWEAPPCLDGSGLDLDEQGRVLTGATLQSPSHPEVLAVGWVAARESRLEPGVGAHATQTGAVLTQNLRGLVGGGPLHTLPRPARTLEFMATGGAEAILSWGGWSAQGTWAAWWKRRRDWRRIQHLRALPDAGFSSRQ